jgi:hypothetical protein
MRMHRNIQKQNPNREQKSEPLVLATASKTARNCEQV